QRVYRFAHAERREPARTVRPNREPCEHLRAHHSEQCLGGGDAGPGRGRPRPTVPAAGTDARPLAPRADQAHYAAAGHAAHAVARIRYARRARTAYEIATGRY